MYDVLNGEVTKWHPLHAGSVCCGAHAQTLAMKGESFVFRLRISSVTKITGGKVRQKKKLKHG